MQIDQLAAMRLFVRIVETSSFAQAARTLGMSASNATARMARLEQTLGVKLLARTTRAVAPTPAGSRYFDTCQRLLAELDDVEASLRDARGTLAGRVRISANAAIARAILIPRLPAWFARHPDIHVELVPSDHRGDFVRDGIDFAVRIGGLEDQDLACRLLGRPRRVTVAAPDYLARMGRPHTPQDLGRHHLVDFLLSDPNQRLDWEFAQDGQATAARPAAVAAVGDAHARLDLAIAGMGIVQTLCFMAAAPLRERRLERLLSEWETAAPAVALRLFRQSNGLRRRLASQPGQVFQGQQGLHGRGRQDACRQDEGGK